MLGLPNFLTRDLLTLNNTLDITESASPGGRKHGISPTGGSKFFRRYLSLDSLYNDLELLDETKVVWVMIDDKLQKTGDDLHFQMASIL